MSVNMSATVTATRGPKCRRAMPAVSGIVSSMYTARTPSARHRRATYGSAATQSAVFASLDSPEFRRTRSGSGCHSTVRRMFSEIGFSVRIPKQWTVQ